MVPLTLIYIACGLMLVTIAIDVFGTHLRRIHAVGQKLSNVANVRVWFGGRRLAMLRRCFTRAHIFTRVAGLNWVI